jgi:hypothetical protein
MSRRFIMAGIFGIKKFAIVTIAVLIPVHTKMAPFAYSLVTERG